MKKITIIMRLNKFKCNDEIHISDMVSYYDFGYIRSINMDYIVIKMTLMGIVYILIDDIVKVAQTNQNPSISVLYIIGKPKDRPYEKNNYSTKTS